MTKKLKNRLFKPLDEEEKLLIKVDEKGDWVDSDNHSNQEWRQLAVATLNKNGRQTIGKN